MERLFDLGMSLESTERQIKNGTYVFHSDAVKTTYSIYTNLVDNTVKRITYRYDLQHHSQDGKISKATPGMNVSEAIPFLIEHYNKYLKRHIELSCGVKDGEVLVSVIFTLKESITPPQELLEEIFSDTQLIVNENKKILKSEVWKILSKRNSGVFIVKPKVSSVQSWANMCEALLKEYNVFVSIYEFEATRDGLQVSAKNYRPIKH